jgi:hypothetical protein
MQGLSDEAEWAKVLSVLPTGWQEAAWATRAIRQRNRPLANPERLLRVLLGRAATDRSYRGAALHARETGLCDVSDVALFKREVKAAPWLDWIAERMLGDTFAELPDSPLRLRLVDATSVSHRGSDRTDFRLHVNVELPGRRFTCVDLTDGHGGESFSRLTVSPGDVVIGDRIYATADGIAHVFLNGGAVLVRTNASSLPLWTPDGERLDPLAAARTLAPGESRELAVEVRPKSGDPVVGRLCIQALPPEQAAKSERRVRRTKLRDGKRAGERAIESANYVLIFTTVPSRQMTTNQVLATYRLRWQVELAFKTLKTVMNFDELPNQLESTSRTWLLSKLICALLLQRLIETTPAIPPSAVAVA